jgi:hypothetical protein
MNKITGCLVCGSRLEYLNKSRTSRCSLCGESFETDVICVNSHFVCDRCHGSDAVPLIRRICENSTGLDPLRLASDIMTSPAVKMHGPEHHFLVPAVLLTAYANVTGNLENKDEWIEKAEKRSARVPGGFCGTHGICGAAIGAGIFISVITGATPLSEEEWKLGNLMTAEILSLIAEYGGPRCCKRDSFLAIIAGSEFIKKHLGVEIPVDESQRCNFYDMNRECLMERCRFFP